MGPLNGIRVVEFAGIGPGPFCAMMLADMGAEVIRLDRVGAAEGPGAKFNVLNRGRRSIALDLKKPEGVDAALRLVDRADALIEGFRPGVMERLGLGPDVCERRNPRLVYGRMTGWGQTGPLKDAAGPDINYIALSGALHAIGTRATPVPPLNLVGDFGGGGMLLAFGIVCALLEAKASGRGQVIDAAMSDGAALLMTFVYGMKAAGHWSGDRESNLVDGGMPFYGCYECACGNWIAIGPIEKRFLRLLTDKLGLAGPPTRDEFAVAFRNRTRAEWCELLEGTDACFAPVLNLDEAPEHPHNLDRGTFTQVDGVAQPAPAPRFSRTPGAIRSGPASAGAHTDELLGELGFAAKDIEALRAAGAIS